MKSVSSFKNGEGQMNFTCSAFARRAAIVILAAFAAALPQIVIAQSDPLAGTWNFVPARSTFTPGPARYKSATLTFSNSGESQMTVEGVDAQGKPVKATYPAVADGKPHPVTGMAAFDTVSWSRFSDTITTYAYLRRKSNVILGSRSLSPDGNILTFNEKTFDDKGKQTGTAVMIFAKPGFELASVTPPGLPASRQRLRRQQGPPRLTRMPALRRWQKTTQTARLPHSPARSTRRTRSRRRSTITSCAAWPTPRRA